MWLENEEVVNGPARDDSLTKISLKKLEQIQLIKNRTSSAYPLDTNKFTRKESKTRFLSGKPAKSIEEQSIEFDNAARSNLSRVLSSNSSNKDHIQVNVEGLLPLINPFNDTRDIKSKERIIRKSKSGFQIGNHVNPLPSKNNPLYDRIVPYMKFSENCYQKLHEIKSVTKSQKEIYQFNNGLLRVKK